MPSETLLPDATVATGSWANAGGGAPGYQDVDEGVDAHDADATMVVGNTATGEFKLGFANTTLTGTFTEIKLRMALRSPFPGSTAGSVDVTPYVNGVALTTKRFTTDASGGYVVREQTWPGSWSAADVHTLQAGLAGASGASRVTAAQAVVTNDTVPSYFSLPPLLDFVPPPRRRSRVYPY